MTAKIIHYPLNQEISAIGGHYLFVKEVRLPYQGREVFYRVAYAAIDRSCCGVGGLAYASVSGFLTGWHTAQTPDGLPVSEVEAIAAPAVREQIARLIRKKETVQQVNFE